MICVTRVKVHPNWIYIKTGQAYTRATAQVSPPDATNPSVKWSSSNPNVVNVHPYDGTMLGINEGTATVYATAQDDSGKRDCCTVVVSKRILVRGITLSDTNLRVEMGRSIDVPVAAFSPDDAENTTVRWCSDNPKVATVANGKIHGHSEGKATITVVATDGSGVSASCKVTVYEKIYVSSVTLSAYSKVLHVGESVKLSAEPLPCDATDRRIMWISSDEEIATVNPTSGLVLAQKPGTTTIRAESLDNSGKKGICTVTVKESIPVDSITFDRTEIRLRPGDRYEIFKVICPSNATNKSLLWTSTDPDVASVNNGVIRAKSNGVTTIIASPIYGANKPISASCSVWVSDYTPVSSVTVSPSSKTMTVGDSFTPHVTVCPEDATNRMLEWRSSDEKVVTVRRDSGYIFAQGPGTATVQALTLEGMGVFDSCQITVKAAVPVSSVRVCPAETSISVGKSACLTATVYPKDATNKSVRWSSDRPDVATVSKTGTATATVTGRSDGTATITAMTADGGFVSSCRVTVDSREVVNIVKEGDCFSVEFSNGTVWKNVSCDPNNKNVYDSALAFAKERYEYNYTQSYSKEQLAFIYLVDPLGMVTYVKDIRFGYGQPWLKRLQFKDALYEEIFGIEPGFFKETYPGHLEYFEKSIALQSREDYYSDAELLFGFHTILESCTLIEFATKAAYLVFSNLVSDIEKLSDAITIFDFTQSLFFASSMTAADYIYSFMGFYGSVYSTPLTEMFSWMSCLVGILDAAVQVITPPNANDINIYKKVDSYYFNTNFKIEGTNYSMKDIIARCEAS